MTTADRSERTTALARATTRRLTATVATLAPFIIEMNLSPYLTAGMLGALTALTFLPEGTRDTAGGQQNGQARPAPAGENDRADAAAAPEAQGAARTTTPQRDVLHASASISRAHTRTNVAFNVHAVHRVQDDGTAERLRS